MIDAVQPKSALAEVIKRFVIHTCCLTTIGSLALFLIGSDIFSAILVEATLLPGIAALVYLSANDVDTARKWSVAYLVGLAMVLMLTMPRAGVELTLAVNMPVLYLWYSPRERSKRRVAFGVILATYIFILYIQCTPWMGTASKSTQIVGWWLIHFLAPIDLVECLHQFIKQQRTHAEALADARDAALVASRAKTRIINAVAHELRTPLATALGLLSEVEASTRGSSIAMQAEGARRETSKVLHRATDLMDLVRLDGEQPIRSTPRAGVPRDRLERVILQSMVASEASFSPETEKCYLFDVDGFGRIARQLLINAHQHGRDPIDLSLHISNEQLILDVRDAGSGILEEYKDRIFDPFEGRPVGPDDAQSGKGIGLALARGLALAAGGELILLPSERGAHFRVVVPIQQATEDLYMIDESIDGLRVLYVDDERLNRTIVKRMLSKLGCNIDLATDGLEAIEKVRVHKYDIVLMDVRMPKMDGLTTTQVIKASAGAPPIIALTANALAGDRERCLSAGMEDFLAKPLHLDRFLEAVARVRSGAPIHRA